MKWVEPKAIHLAGTELDTAGSVDYLDAVGAPGWDTDAPTGAEALVEIGGRVCYRSFEPGLNPNVTKVRRGNAPYIANVIAQRHGALLEHASDTYLLYDISRVVSHQIVRHRAGTAYSQESGHYVRVEGVKMRFPHVFVGHPREAELRALFEEEARRDEAAQLRMAELLEVDSQPFEVKKAYTTAMRRLVPDGLATALVVTANHRAWRWMIQLRTERHNDEEIRQVFADVWRQQRGRYPNLYADSAAEMVDGEMEVTFEHEKA